MIWSGGAGRGPAPTREVSDRDPDEESAMTLPRDPDATVPVLQSIPDAARIIATSRSTLWAHVYAGNVASVRLGRAVRITSDELARISREGLPARPRSRRSQ